MNFERLWHWQRFEPDLGDNLDVPPAQRLFLEVAVGLTKVELAAFGRAIAESRVTPEQAAVSAYWAEVEPTRDTLAAEPLAEVSRRLDELSAKRDAAYVAKLAAAWAPFVRLGPGQHAINGQPLVTLVDYLGFVCGQAGRYNLIELDEEVERLNTVAGARALFSGPLSGGTTSTRTRSTAPGGSQTGGR